MVKYKLKFLTAPDNVMTIGINVWQHFYDTYEEDFQKLDIERPEVYAAGSKEEREQYARLVKPLKAISPQLELSDKFFEALQTLERFAEHDDAQLRDFMTKQNEELQLEEKFWAAYPDDEQHPLSYLELAVVMWCDSSAWSRMVGFITYIMQDRSAMVNYSLKDQNIKTTLPSPDRYKAMVDEFRKMFKEKELSTLYCEVEMFQLTDNSEDDGEDIPEEEYCFTISHADRPKRRSRVENGAVESFSYQPPTTEVIVYNTRSRNIRMNTDLKGKGQQIADIFSRLLTDGEYDNAYQKAPVFSFAPIESGKAYLETCGVANLNCVRLRLLETQELDAEGNPAICTWRSCMRQSINNFVDYRKPRAQGSVRKVAFELHFGTDRQPIVVKLNSIYSIIAPKYRRAQVDNWLRKSGFIRQDEQ